MNKIQIALTDKADTHSANIKDVTTNDVLTDTVKHITAVQLVSAKLFDMGDRQIQDHDYTKISFLEMFTEALKTGFTDDDFTNLNWYKDIHVVKERHHLLKRCPDDVNLIDVIEMVVDCVCACKARTPNDNLKHTELPVEILQKALANTFKLVFDNVEAVKSPVNENTYIQGPYDKN